MMFCLQLGKMSRIWVKEFLELNHLNVHDRYLQFIISDIFKFYINQCPDYFNEVFSPVNKNGLVLLSSQSGTKSHLKCHYLSPSNTLVLPKIKFPVHSHLEYMLQKVFKMAGVKLTINRLLLGIY